MANSILKVNWLIVVYVSCIFGFLYQSYDLYSAYMSGKTVVNIKVETILNQTLPGITVCSIPKYIPAGIDINGTLTEELKKHFNQSKRGKHGGYYDIPRVLNYLTSNMNMVDFIEKVSRPFTLEQHISNNILVGIIGLAPNSINNTAAIKIEEGYFIRNGIKSLLMKRNKLDYADLNFCLTFFSHLEKEWRDMKINLNRLLLMIGNEYYEFDETFHLAIHSQNSLPSEENLIKIAYGTENTIQYSEVRTQLLSTGFDTNCFDYDLDHKFANYNMRSDCITQCMLKKKPEKFGNILPGRMMRKEFYQNKGDIRALFRFRYGDKFYFISYASAEIDCLQECRKDCKFSYFINSYENKGNFEETRMKTRNLIIHSPFPDILITHLPEITFNAFVCNFGGLLGLWLGLSVFAIFSEFRDICIKLFGKKIILF